MTFYARNSCTNECNVLLLTLQQFCSPQSYTADNLYYIYTTEVGQTVMNRTVLALLYKPCWPGLAPEEVRQEAKIPCMP